MIIRNFVIPLSCFFAVASTAQAEGGLYGAQAGSYLGGCVENIGDQFSRQLPDGSPETCTIVSQMEYSGLCYQQLDCTLPDGGISQVGRSSNTSGLFSSNTGGLADPELFGD